MIATLKLTCRVVPRISVEEMKFERECAFQFQSFVSDPKLSSEAKEHLISLSEEASQSLSEEASQHLSDSQMTKRYNKIL